MVIVSTSVCVRRTGTIELGTLTSETFTASL